MHDDSPSGCSIASLLVLTVLVAIVAAAYAPALTGQQKVDWSWAVGGIVVGLVPGGVIGLVIGIVRTGRVGGSFLGLEVGVFGGGMAGALLAAPGALPAILVGSLVLILFGFVVRSYSQ